MLVWWWTEDELMLSCACLECFFVYVQIHIHIRRNIEVPSDLLVRPICRIMLQMFLKSANCARDMQGHTQSQSAATHFPLSNKEHFNNLDGAFFRNISSPFSAALERANPILHQALLTIIRSIPRSLIADHCSWCTPTCSSIRSQHISSTIYSSTVVSSLHCLHADWSNVMSRSFFLSRCARCASKSDVFNAVVATKTHIACARDELLPQQ